jgi:O-antigen/teichoic acid export membrane protein
VFAGIYSFTYTVSLIPQILFASLSKVWEPWFFEQMDKGDDDAIRKGSYHFFILISSTFVLMACIVPEVVKIMATPEYYDCMDICILILLGCYFATLYYIPCEVEYFHKKTKYIAFSTVSCAVLNIILNYYLLTHYSYKSAAIATVVSYFLYFLFHMYMARRICGHWLFDVRRMGIGILIFFVLMAITLTNIPNILVRILVFLCVTGYTYYYFRDFIDSKVRAYITAWKK